MVSIVLYLTEGAANAQDTFQGYECTVDCSGHEAGYEWANRNGITDPGDCGGNSQSFVEGCQAFAEENYDPADDYGSDDDEDREDEEE